MTGQDSLDFNMADIGFGTMPRGDVNVDFFRSGFNPQTGDQIKGGFVHTKNVKNFVMADATHLPFRDDAFDVAFSSHTIEHVHNPMLMLREMCRIARRKAILRFPHRRGSGAVMPYHINYLDENWFQKTSEILGYESSQFITGYDYPITSRINKFVPKQFQKNLPWRAFQHFERRHLKERFRIPFEMEAWVKKKRNLTDSAKVKFVVIYNRPEIFQKYFASSPYVSSDSVTAYYNVDNEPLPKLFNKMVQEHLKENLWFAFCHQDFLLQEDLSSRLRGKNVEAVYGPIGVRLADSRFLGMIITQSNDAQIGIPLKEDTPVQTLDEMCLIAHSTVFRHGLFFDERFPFHFYGADFCMRAYTMGFDILATQLKCQHKSKTPTGDLSSREYAASLKLFREKWKHLLPIKTSTTLVA
jgi:SAM-dependent methyltransferase